MPGAVKPNPPGEAKPEGLSKYIKRMRTVLRRGSVAKSASGAEGAAGAAANTEGRHAGHTTPPTATPVPTTTTPPNPPSNQPIVISHWGAIQEERTRALFAKYGLPLSQCDLRPVDASVQRVAKPIRMRVRRSCHRCQTVFGVARVCVNCQHTRCKSCPRYPAPKPKADSEAVLRNLLAQKGKMPLYRQQGQGQGQTQTQTQTHRETQGQGQKQPRPGHYVLKLPSRTGGQDLVRKPIRQRVRRTCHRCQTTFASGSKQCSDCQHVRCKKCPRDPPKLDKYPDGYPGDVDPPPEPPARTWKKPRRRVRYTCHQCATLYRSGQKICAGCGQERCAETLREPPERVKPESDPDIVRKVEERLASLRLGVH